MQQDHEQNPFEKPSKSQRKREATALQTLGQQLVELTSAQLDKVSPVLPANLLQAILAARQYQQRGAYKRQLQYIGKLMRDIDPEPIQQALDKLLASNVAAKRELHYLEKLCQALLDNEQTIIDDFYQRYPEADRQHIRQLTRNAIQEIKRDKLPKSRRLLFRYLRDVVNADNGVT